MTRRPRLGACMSCGEMPVALVGRWWVAGSPASWLASWWETFLIYTGIRKPYCPVCLRKALARRYDIPLDEITAECK
jgi:hypothetical protein